MNASGVALTDAELALAQISGYWPQARDTFKAKLSALEKEGYVLKLDFVVYVLGPVVSIIGVRHCASCMVRRIRRNSSRRGEHSDKHVLVMS